MTKGLFFGRIDIKMQSITKKLTEIVSAAFEKCGIEPTARAESLKEEQFAALSNELFRRES